MEVYKLTRHQSREAALIFFYTYFLYKKNEDFNLEKFIKKNIGQLDYILQDKYDTEKEIDIINDELFIEILNNINDIPNYIKEIEKNLDKDWSFERLSLVEQAILILSITQIKNKIPKKIVINEAIELSKNYCDEDAYKFINGILDKIDE